MDIQSKLKHMYDRASRESFTHRFYKTFASHSEPEEDDDGPLKHVEWFSTRNNEAASQGGVIELAAPMINRDYSQERRSSLGKVSTTHHLHPSSEIMSSLQDKSTAKNADITIRSTKIVCTLGRITREEEPIARMIRKGMNVARINMNYFEIHEQNEMMRNVRSAAQKEGRDVAIMIDLKGPLIRTLGFRDTMYSIQVRTGEEVRISSNKGLKGEPGMFGIDYDRIHEKLVIGDKVLVDYGGVVLTVKGFEYEKTYLSSNQRRKKTTDIKAHLESGSPKESADDPSA